MCGTFNQPHISASERDVGEVEKELEEIMAIGLNCKPKDPRNSINSNHKKYKENYTHQVQHNLYEKMFNYKFNVFIRFRAVRLSISS